jgi:carbamoyltransferase
VIVLGVSRQLHDPAAALLVDGRCVAAAEEERFTRVKHAAGTLPLHAVRFCLEHAGVAPAEVQAVAWPWSHNAWARRRWAQAWRARGRLRRAWSILRRDRSHEGKPAMAAGLATLGLPMDRLTIQDVEHHLTHAASAHLFSGFDRSAILSIDASGEFDTTWAAAGDGPRIQPIKHWTEPDSLGFFYGTATDFCGFHPNDGEFKTMGMAAYGDPSKADLKSIIQSGDGDYAVSGLHCHVPRARAYEGRWFSNHWVDLFGPPRSGAELTEPHIHVAAAAQRAFEAAVIEVVRGPLAPVLEAAGGRLTMAGGCALNVVLNQRLRELPEVTQLFVQPASHDAGGALGAAARVASSAGDTIEPWRDGQFARLGPDVTAESAKAACAKRALPYTIPQALSGAVAALLAAGEVVAWVQGRMEWGPRALGGRSLLAHPSKEGARRALDAAIKAREPWRPYCPAILDERAGEILEGYAPSPFLTQNFTVQQSWRERLRHAIHVDGTARAQTVTAQADPAFHALISAFAERTAIPALLNTSLNRHDEPIAATADDALEIFCHTGLRHLALGPLLLSKTT